MLTNSRLLRISSKDRSPQSNSRYDIEFNTNDNDLHQIKRITLKSVVIPNTQYNINKYNNTLYFPTSHTATTDYVIKQGQYTTSELITAINTAVNAVISPAVLQITQDLADQKLTFTLSAGTMDIHDDTQNRMAKVLGIDTGLNGVSVYVCDHLPNLSGLGHIYISSQALSNHTQMISHDKQKQNVFADVTMKVGFGQSQYTDEDSNSLDYVVFPGLKNISRLDIKLMDENNNELDLNGRDWTIIFRVFG
jgi:hypothetical protein